MTSFNHAPTCLETEHVNPPVAAALNTLEHLIKCDMRQSIAFTEFLSFYEKMPLELFEDTQVDPEAKKAVIPDIIIALNPLFDRVVNGAYCKTQMPTDWNQDTFEKYVELQAWINKAPKKGLPNITLLIEFIDETPLLLRFQTSLEGGYLSASMIYRLAIICDRHKRTSLDGVPAEFLKCANTLLKQIQDVSVEIEQALNALRSIVQAPAEAASA
jgi:hypothetical protein